MAPSSSSTRAPFSTSASGSSSSSKRGHGVGLGTGVGVGIGVGVKLALSLCLAGSASASVVRLGCINSTGIPSSAVPASASASALASASSIGMASGRLDEEAPDYIACSAQCERDSYTYAFFTSPGSCACSNDAPVATTYVDALDTSATCGEDSTWYTTPTPSLNSTTTCPYLGPGSSTQLSGYEYLGSFPAPIDCLSACGGTSESSRSSSTPRVALLQPGLGGWSCACADELGRASYTAPCGPQSWYAVVQSGSGNEDEGAADNTASKRRSRR